MTRERQMQFVPKEARGGVGESMRMGKQSVRWLQWCKDISAANGQHVSEAKGSGEFIASL